MLHIRKKAVCGIESEGETERKREVKGLGHVERERERERERKREVKGLGHVERGKEREREKVVSYIPGIVMSLFGVMA